MKKTLFILIILLCQKGFTQNTVVMFLDIPDLDGEYTTPTRVKFTAQNPKAQNILLSGYKYSWAAETNFTSGQGASVGKPNQIGEMTLHFQLDKSVIGLYQRLVNNTKIPEMDIFIDKPGIQSGPNQTELSRIKMYDVVIRSLALGSNEIPEYTMRIRFEKVSMIINTFNSLGVGAKGAPYCFDYQASNSMNCFAF
ncbi:MAG: type VI secretion system tube protein Hcp [Leadbetterella sp.]